MPILLLLLIFGLNLVRVISWRKSLGKVNEAKPFINSVFTSRFSTTAALYSINSSEDYQRTTANDVQVFPRLNAKPEAANVLLIETGAQTKIKQNEESVWVAEDKFDYPASSNLYKKLLVNWQICVKLL